MTENLKKHHSLIQLAEEFHMSPTTLKKLFLRVYGETPYHYLRRRRMEEAALMLQTTSLRIGRIGELVGYQNASKFSAAFQEVYGVRPLEYKNGVLLE